MEEHKNKLKLGVSQKLWQKLCCLFVVSFYKKIEITGADILNNIRPIILCANHSNALADAVLLQYTSKRLIHPLARSGLFKNPILKIILSVWQAVPVYRRQDSEDGVVDNDAMFIKAYEMLAKNEVLMIFPEGQSHSDLQLKQLKTGVSRIILGYKEKYNEVPLVIPIGLNFTNTVKFRSNVYINFGKPVEIENEWSLSEEQDVKTLTDRIMMAMKGLVLEVEEVEDLVFVKQVERFFSLRHKKSRKRNLSQKFKSHKLLLTANEYLHKTVPDKVDEFKHHLRHFNRLCNKLGINDYNLSVSYNSQMIRKFVLRSFFIILVVLPVGLYGFINSFLPYLMTKISSRLLSKGDDQYDTSKILTGTLFFSVFWFLQTQVVYSLSGLNAAIIYVVLLLPTSLTALIIEREQHQIIDNLRVFIILIRSGNLRRYLLKKRKNIEKELASLIKLARNNNQY
ncbi:MAG: hypothetical protein DIZ80_16915 [endosymbiont of Galathealinum brachiosum]|uniref:Phospholipid/glycerol acyltransferase domain-containing protein n=1 Tax=endosymbiont of Galathealinum brachiosum TaxID=2200906 RepID=A0A370D6Q9_9GAMM|nr:MAG: hypothetical protein DIZ80_16915 [endosymbiont of Galathealinum brachiosum]